MSGNLSVRLLTAIGIVAVCFGIVFWTSIHGVPRMVLPEWHLKELPKDLGSWSWDGKTIEVDPLIFRAIGAVEVENRDYHHPSRGAVKLHFALFDDAQEGLRHSPINCYREGGWTRISEEVVPMTDDPKQSKKMLICLWEKEGARCMTGHWYQVGDDQVFDRSMGLTSLRLKRFGSGQWPAMVKVLLDIPVTNSEKDSDSLKDIAHQISQWLHQVQKLP